MGLFVYEKFGGKLKNDNGKYVEHVGRIGDHALNISNEMLTIAMAENS